VRQIYFLLALNKKETSYQLTQYSDYTTVTELENYSRKTSWSATDHFSYL